MAWVRSSFLEWGESEDKGGALAEFAIDGDGGVVCLSNVFDDGQPQAGTHGVVAGGLLGTIVLFKDSWQGVLADAYPVVGDLDAGRAIFEPTRTDGYAPSGVRILDSVG